MKTEPFSLASATATQILHTLTRVIRYDEGSGTGTPLIRVRSLSSGELDVQMQPGRQVALPVAVDGIVITNLTGSAITGKITIGAGDITDNSLVGTVTLDASTLAALDYVQVRPEAPTGFYGTNLGLSANAAENIFTGVANVNGAIVLSGNMRSTNATRFPDGGFIASVAAPTNIFTRDYVMPMAHNDYSPAGAFCSSGVLHMPQYVDAGVGLWALTDVNEAGTRIRSCRYKLL